MMLQHTAHGTGSPAGLVYRFCYRASHTPYPEEAAPQEPRSGHAWPIAARCLRVRLKYVD
ncbi:hypothetical protein SGFS_071910 [Streptomyces graminofaciens]|uniref:Uncharacterized protein n=1 Tax=Streptomyces graminofaciens TaxID=68212 RepID=A0ABM7FFP5_9ACTN|nr:hypothetical protein SGFS_071910 [Streptomyces graminofaciens]